MILKKNCLNSWRSFAYMHLVAKFFFCYITVYLTLINQIQFPFQTRMIMGQSICGQIQVYILDSDPFQLLHQNSSQKHFPLFFLDRSSFKILDVLIPTALIPPITLGGGDDRRRWTASGEWHQQTLADRTAAPANPSWPHRD